LLETETESTFQRCTDYVDIAGCSSARICRVLTFALARLSCLVCGGSGLVGSVS